MVPSLLLALTVIIVMIDVLVGIHRGFQYSLVRLLLWAAGTVIALLIARSVTVFILLKMAKVPDMKMFAFDVFGSRLNDLTDSVGTHLSGLTVSFMVPVVFSALFLITKFITWIIYIFVKKLIIKSAKKATAHNAAVDAVKAVESSEMPDIASDDIEQPVNLTGRNSDGANDPEFGTFGIYPKDEERPRPVMTDEAPVQEKTVDAFAMLATAEEPVGDPMAMLAETAEEVSEAVEEAEETEIADGFEALAASSEDGFESLARASLMEETDNAAPTRSSGTRKVKTRKIKVPKFKRLKKKHSIASFLIQKSKVSSVFGGILGGIVALYSCAIVFAPLSNMISIISGGKMAGEAVDLMATVVNEDVGELIDNAFVKTDKKPDNYPKVFEISDSFSLRPEDFKELFDTAGDSVAHYIYKYSGADFVATAIYDYLSPVKPEDIDLINKGTAVYNFPQSLKYYNRFIPATKAFIDTIRKGEGVSYEVVDRIERFLILLFSNGGEGDVLTDSDKLDIANNITDTLNDEINKVLGPYSTDRVLKQFESYDQVNDGMSDVFNEVRRLIKQGFFERNIKYN
ncbi:MAG: hypothetical protein IK014_12730 [Lachnospiraceae bacterium]|nr:hypothetical protein [Lachnospiraceae bacterium]